MSPVDTTVGRFAATDLDTPPQLFYTLTSVSNDFRLKGPTIPEILVNTRLDYDKVKEFQLQLEAQDTPLDSIPSGPSFTATTTIMITILDGDNRPPWFQPCNTYDIGGVVICENAGYTGSVNLNEQETGVLPLKPGPLYAVDGDSGINEEITYSFLRGNEDGLFGINPNTGNITMLRPTDVLGPISLTTLASQKFSSHQFATSTVTISVQVKSLHPPKFQRPRYEALITSVGSMAKDLKNTEESLQILATDDDYTATEGLNPHIVYSVDGNSDFSIIGGFLFMTKDLPDATLTLQVLAKDVTNDETATAQLLVEVKSVIPPSGEYGAVDMAALGATLGVLLFICLVVIGVLVHRMKKSKADWGKVNEASIFRSSLGQGSGSQKEGVQYTNDAFQRDEDSDSVGSGGPTVKAAEVPPKSAWDLPPKEAIQMSSAPLHALLPDNTSDTSSDKVDNEKEVKPILTKERRVEEGYKSVWFKEDIDPNSKEEVVIIPDSREDESDEEEPSSSGREDDEDDNPKKKSSKVFFADPDLDSGIGVRIGDPAEDSDSDKDLNIDL
ncbi:cadherin-related family member 5 isoform X2 [Melanotaenia boesemani]|uniref:cadherin-related family member 5 isoform X2 n=1 Tax=Melanotaenia boesemani TaxID=1250792 RepID=UPI001C0557FF|nr:cadherin-related family member 5 isoform X2 [Melanotaenia boesemani]